MFDFHHVWGYVAIIANGIAGIIALVAWKKPSFRGRHVWIATIVAEGAILLQVLTGTILVSCSLYFNGERHGGPAGGDEMYFLWIVLWAAYHLRRRALAVQLAAILGAYGVALYEIHPGPMGHVVIGDEEIDRGCVG